LLAKRFDREKTKAGYRGARMVIAIAPLKGFRFARCLPLLGVLAIEVTK
jgi:hypothetical protein